MDDYSDILGALSQFNPAQDSQMAYAQMPQEFNPAQDSQAAYAQMELPPQAFNPAQDSQAAYAQMDPATFAVPQGATPAFNSAQDSQQAYAQMAAAMGNGMGGTPATQPSALEKLGKNMGLLGDISNPATLDQWMRLLVGMGGLYGALRSGNKQRNALSPTQLQDSLGPKPYNSFTPAQEAGAQAYFNAPTPAWNTRGRVYSSSGPAPVSKYAGGLTRAME